MRPNSVTRTIQIVCVVVILSGATGCQSWRMFYMSAPPPPPIGVISDDIWQRHERNAEHADFIISQHEFREDTEFLNTAGEDHVKEVAARLNSGQDARVIVERSFSTPRENTEHHYPIHPNPALDLRRRELIVMCLKGMGVVDADVRVLVAPSFAQPMRGEEAERAYLRSGEQGSGSGFGGFFFGGFGGGGMGGMGGMGGGFN